LAGVAPPWYRTKEPSEVLQGDIYNAMPSVYVSEQALSAVRTAPAAQGRVHAGLHKEGVNPPEDGFRFEEGEDLVVRGVRHPAVMMTHECEIPKDSQYRILALIRPWLTLPADIQDKIRHGRRYRFFWLPGQTEPPAFPESYVDLRRLTPVRPEVLREEDRMLSMTEPMREALAAAFIRYITRKEVL
jgi:hypothetical protein